MKSPGQLANLRNDAPGWNRLPAGKIRPPAGVGRERAAFPATADQAKNPLALLFPVETFPHCANLSVQ